MPKKKDYRSPRSQSKQIAGPAIQVNPSHAPDVSPDIDLVELLGPEARFASNTRNVILRHQLGRGIDEWVFATTAAIQTMLLAGKSTANAVNWKASMLSFYDFVTTGAKKGANGIQVLPSKPATPADLNPIHIEQFVVFLLKTDKSNGLSNVTTRMKYQRFKTVVLTMFSLALVPGEPNKFFRRGVFTRDGESMTTSMSDGEQERLASAIKKDLSAIHHGRLLVTMRELQALRLLVVAHRMGHNTTPLLELTRNAIRPGLLPGTILIQTVKGRGKRIASQMAIDGSSTPMIEEYLPFGLSEGAVIGQAIASTQHLVDRAPKSLRNRVWLYEVSHTGGSTESGTVSALSAQTLIYSIQTLVKRHTLLGDDGKSLVVNNSRLRKSRFDRAYRLSDGDLMITANLMGNTPAVAGVNYPSMNAARQAEAAGFMNDDYIEIMRNGGSIRANSTDKGNSLRLVAIDPVSEAKTATPVAGCSDALGGEYAPKNGNPCDRFVMCLFCSSFAIVGTVDELWRLFSFQTFAQEELNYLEDRLGKSPEISEQLERLLDLRDRYRLAIPYIDSFVSRQFATSRVLQARKKTANTLHPFWVAQMKFSRRARLEITN